MIRIKYSLFFSLIVGIGRSSLSYPTHAKRLSSSSGELSLNRKSFKSHHNCFGFHYHCFKSYYFLFWSNNSALRGFPSSWRFGTWWRTLSNYFFKSVFILSNHIHSKLERTPKLIVAFLFSVCCCDYVRNHRWIKHKQRKRSQGRYCTERYDFTFDFFDIYH